MPEPLGLSGFRFRVEALGLGLHLQVHLGFRVSGLWFRGVVRQTRSLPDSGLMGLQRMAWVFEHILLYAKNCENLSPEVQQAPDR